MYKDETNKKYGKLTVLSRVANDKYGNARWKCKCECGKYHTTNSAPLRNGACISCGCAKKEYINRRSGEAPLKNNYSRYKHGAIERKLEFKISLEQFKIIITQNCHYCGIIPNNKKYAYHRTRYSKGKESDEYIIAHGIDRKDNNKGYTIENCLPCCKMCNGMKSKLSYNDFIEQIKKINGNLKL